MTPETPKAWREDFPVDWDRDHFVARRDFVKFMVLTGAGFTTGQLAIGFDQWLRGRPSYPRVRLCGVEEVPVGGSRPFAYPNEHEPCLLIRTDNESWVAYGQKCTHLACAVVPQPQHNRLYCPCHEGAFSLVDGRPIQGPPRRPLPRVTLEISDGSVYATGLELRTT